MRDNFESQAEGLINLVLQGEDPVGLMNHAMDEIQEGSGGGPYPIGSAVRVNQPWTGVSVQGGPVALTKGDVVSVIQPNLGEQGTDRMVLLADGKTRVVVPLVILGEGMEEEWDPEEEEDDDLDEQTHPAGYKVSPAKGPALAKSGRVLGQPKPQSLPQPKGMGSPSSSPSMAVGKGKPKDDPAAQPPGSGSPATMSGKALEMITRRVAQIRQQQNESTDIRSEVMEALTLLMDGSSDLEKARIAKIQQMVQTSESSDQLQTIYSMLFDEENNYSLTDLESFLETGGGEEKNGKKKPPLKKKEKEGKMESIQESEGNLFARFDTIEHKW